MQNINIGTGEISLSVNGDPKRLIAFNPRDTLFAQKFYRLIGNFRTKSNEYISRATQMDAVTDVDESGLPLNLQERLDLVNDICGYVREQIDIVFGEGTSQIAFGDANSLDAIGDFFDGITPYVRQARANKVEKYIPKKSSKPRKRK